MLYKVEATNRRGSVLPLILDDETDGIIVNDIDGLEPVKATISSSSFAQQDGTQYHSSRRESRNIKIKLDLEPDFVLTSVEDLRNQLYDFFMPKTEVRLRFFMTNGLTVDISGRIEDFVSPLFAKEPTADISIICFDPDFVSLTPVVINGLTTSTTDEILVPYPGTVETGILFTLNVDRPLADFTIYHRAPNDTIRSLDFAASLVAGDVLTISTVQGDKRVVLTRSGTDSSLLYGKSPQSGWTELEKGDNYLRIYATGAGIPFTVSFTPRYGGL